MTEKLKYPAGEWTHGDFAEVNGKTKPSVYNQLQAALKDGTVVKTEKRSVGGKGKPSQYYKLADATAPVVIPATPAPAPVVVTPTPVIEVKPEPVVETPVVINPEPVVVVDVVPVVVDPTPVAKVEPVTELAPDTHSTTYPCPVCKKNLLAWKDATGVMVKCLQPIEVCKSTENPFGHGKNEKEAVEVLNQKWGFAIKGSPVQ